jgi:hypothetical protein
LYLSREINDPAIKKYNKERLTHLFIVKLFGERRRKYRAKMNTFMIKKKDSSPKKSLSKYRKMGKPLIRDGVIIKFTDGL